MRRVLIIARLAAGTAEPIFRALQRRESSIYRTLSALEPKRVMPTITGREFNQDVARAKRAARQGPVIITDRGRPAYVLMRHETYRRLRRQGPGIRVLLSHPESEEIDFKPPRLGDEPFRSAKLG